MENLDNTTMLGLNSDGDDLFDFEAASCAELCTSAPSIPVPQTQAVQAEDDTHLMVVTQSEMEAIIAVRASNAQDCDRDYSLAQPERNINFSRIEEPGAFGACFDYDGADMLISPTFSDFDMLEDGNAPLNTLDGFGAFEQARFEQSADPPVAVADGAPDIVSQSDQPINLESVRQAWLLGSKCTWPECTSSAVFKTRASFNMHVTNVHTNPLLCLVSNCPHTKPFGRPSDLKRHENSAHSGERGFVCTVSSCDARIKEFARKDHLTKHMRERHDNYFCPFNHCPHSTRCSFAKPEDVVEHINTEHGLYECALLDCGPAPLSKFSRISLINHLRNHHSMPETITISIVEQAGYRDSQTVTRTDLGRGRCGECKVCEKRRDGANK